MKTKKFVKSFLILTLTFCLVVFTSCSDDNDLVREYDVIETAVNSPNLSILVSALQRADLVSALQASAPFTVFAPTNAAFQELLESNSSWDSFADIPIATLDAVLRYHVFAAGNVQYSQLTGNQVITMFDGNDLTLDLSSGAKLEASSSQSVTISLTDVQGTNGIIHVVDSVLLS